MYRRIPFVRPGFALLLPAVLLGSLPACSSSTEPASFPAITSTFETGDEGWTVAGDGDGPFWAANGDGPFASVSGGNPGGYIYAVDRAEGPLWYWVAPAKFSGDVSGAYRHFLKFDLIQDQIPDKDSSEDVIMIGGGLELRYNMNLSRETAPSTTWTTYSVEFHQRRWRHRDTREVATEEELKQVMRSLETLLIRGEFFKGVDIGGLRNVVLGAPS